MIKQNNFSYRDDAARVVRKGLIYYRYIFQSYKSEYDHLMNSGLYNELVAKELLIEHEEVNHTSHKESDVYKLILPYQIPFQSYPFEWSFNQWKKAILAYLSINIIALKYGMILKDGTPYNFFLIGGQAKLFDTSSFIFINQNDNWTAYRQFCEEFLAPISLMYYNDSRWSNISMSFLRGIELSFVSQHLPIKSYFNLVTLLNLHLQSKFLVNTKYSSKINTRGFGLDNLVYINKHLYKSILKWKKKANHFNIWANYYEEDIESENYIKSKESIVRDVLTTTNPKSVLDLGANSGKFTFISSEYSKKVIAVESDYQCVDIIENDILRMKRNNVYTLNAKIPEFSNGLGLNGEEVRMLSERIKSDLVLALALVHHLHITFYLSFFQIAEQLSILSTKYVLVEFIPKCDNKVKILVGSKKLNLIGFNEDEFEKAFSSKFKLLRKENIATSSRKIYLFEKHNYV